GAAGVELFPGEDPGAAVERPVDRPLVQRGRVEAAMALEFRYKPANRGDSALHVRGLLWCLRPFFTNERCRLDQRQMSGAGRFAGKRSAGRHRDQQVRVCADESSSRGMSGVEDMPAPGEGKTPPLAAP